MATITVKARGYVATLDMMTHVVQICTTEGVYVTSGVWCVPSLRSRGEGSIDECSAELGGSKEESERIYEALDTAIGDELDEEDRADEEHAAEYALGHEWHADDEASS